MDVLHIHVSSKFVSTQVTYACVTLSSSRKTNVFRIKIKVQSAARSFDWHKSTGEISATLIELYIG